jgi:hypothetical protein
MVRGRSCEPRISPRGADAPPEIAVRCPKRSPCRTSVRWHPYPSEVQTFDFFVRREEFLISGGRLLKPRISLMGADVPQAIGRARIGSRHHWGDTHASEADDTTAGARRLPCRRAGGHPCPSESSAVRPLVPATPGWVICGHTSSRSDSAGPGHRQSNLTWFRLRRGRVTSADLRLWGQPQRSAGAATVGAGLRAQHSPLGKRGMLCIARSTHSAG